MRKWIILISVLAVGTVVALGILAFVKTKTPEVETASDGPRAFFTFFKEQLGITGEEPSSQSEFPATTTPAQGPTFRQRLAREILLPISDAQLAGAYLFVASGTTTQTAGTSTPKVVRITEERVRFVERETGHVSDLSLETGLTTRLSNTTVPRIQEAMWGRGATAVALRYLSDDNETIETFIAPLSTSTDATTTDLTGTFFPQNIKTFAFSPSSKEIFYITTTDTSAVGRVSTFALGSPRVVFSSPLREWTAQWKTPGEIYVSTKPSSQAVGVAESVAVSSGASRRILSNISGLSVLPSPSGSKVLYSSAGSQSLNTFVLSVSPQTTITLPVSTLPEKCIWKNDVDVICAVPNSVPANTPDTWHQGLFTFTDTLWLIHTDTNQVDFLFAPEETGAGVTMDITELSLSSDGTILSFINKKDLRGWVADLGQQ